MPIVMFQVKRILTIKEKGANLKMKILEKLTAIRAQVEGIACDWSRNISSILINGKERV